MPGKFAQREHSVSQRFEPGAPAEVGKVDDERTAHQRCVRRTDEPSRRFSGAAGRDEIVDEQHALAARQRIAMDFEAIAAVLQRIVLAEIFGWQLALLANRDKPGAEPVRERTSKDESARFDRRDLVDAPIAYPATRRSTTSRNPPGAFSSVVISRNCTPAFGKSGIVRIIALMSTALAMASPPRRLAPTLCARRCFIRRSSRSRARWQTAPARGAAHTTRDRE
jgi:hypothetical protein